MRRLAIVKSLQSSAQGSNTEYYSASTAAAEILYLHNLLDRMGFAQQAPTPATRARCTGTTRRESSGGNNVIGGRECAKNIDIWIPEALRAPSDPEGSHDACPRANYFPAGGHLDQAAALPALASVCCRHLGHGGNNHFRDLCPQEGMLAPTSVTSALLISRKLVIIRKTLMITNY